MTSYGSWVVTKPEEVTRVSRVSPPEDITDEFVTTRRGMGLKPGDREYGTHDAWKNELDERGVGRFTVMHCSGGSVYGQQWPDTLATDSVTVYKDVGQGCSPGFRKKTTRTCARGGWDPTAVTQCERVVCLAGMGFPETKVGESATAPCDTGFSGTRSRNCRASGWGEITTSQCRRIACPAEGVWPLTAADSFAYAPCTGANMTGKMRRHCRVDGTWAPVPDRSGCRRGTCGPDHSGGWLQVPVGQRASKPCPAGFVGNQYRACTKDGFQAVDSSKCKLISDPPTDPSGPAVAPPPQLRDIRPEPQPGVPLPVVGAVDPRENVVPYGIVQAYPSFAEQWEDVPTSAKLIIAGGAAAAVALITFG